MPEVGSTRTNWADDVDEVDDVNALPEPQITENSDGTKTIISYRIEDSGEKVKITQKVKIEKKKTKVNHAVAERKKWKKYGEEAGKPPGPDFTTTSVGENIPLHLMVGWKSTTEEEVVTTENKEKGDKFLKCRLCGGEHFTYKCPYKIQLEPLVDVGGSGAESSPNATPARLASPAPEVGGSDSKKFIPPHLRPGAAAALASGERSSPSPVSYRDRDRSELYTLRVTNLSTEATEEALRGLFGRFGDLARVFIAKDRETGVSRGFAFISFFHKLEAERALKRLNGYGFLSLILQVEVSDRK